MRTVVVRLRGRPHLSLAARPGRRAQLQAVQDELRATAEAAQAPLVSRLQTWKRHGKARAIKRLWISNSIRVSAKPRVIQHIKDRADVVSVVPDAITVTPAAGPPAANQLAIQAPTVWAAGHTGEGVVVASLDSGVDGTHDDLATRWRGGSNSWFDPYGQHPAAPTDLTGHGTGVMGAMVAGDASGASLGAAPGASWIAARVFNDTGTSTVSAIHQAFQWLLDPDGNPATADAPNVVNASWSLGAGPGCDLTFQPDVQALRAAGIATVFPAGNFGSAAGSSVSPANYPESISVGAVNAANNLIYSASGRGPSTCGGRTRAFPDVVAPGVNILTTDRYGLYQYQTGTSVASPHVAGALALLLSAKPGLTPDQQQQLLLDTATDLGAAGADETYGHGLINVAAAYAALPQPSFDLTLSPASSSVEAGTATSFQVGVAPVNGFADDVNLAVTGLPGSAGSASFTPPVIIGGSGTATLEVSTDPAAGADTFVLSVSASGGGVVQEGQVTLEITEPPAASDELYFATVGTGRPPGITGTPDNSDIYHWSGSAYERIVDATALGLPKGTAVDGYARVDDSHFYVSFGPPSTTVPGLGYVQDEDVVYYDNGVWSTFFDGTAYGLTTNGGDLDAINLVGSTLYFSTKGNVKPPGVSGPADNSDIYRWDGSSLTRVWDATSEGLPQGTNVDGLVWADSAHLHLSFQPDVTVVPGLGAVEDEDVITLDAGAWSTYFDGTAHGLGGASNLDLNAFDLP